MKNETIIAMDDLYASYGRTQAVNGISLAVDSGECFGLLGPNGAGKTTTLSCLEGIKRPDRGTITVKGVNALKHGARVKRMLGVQIQDATLFPDLTCANLIELFASFYSVFLTRRQILEHLAHVDLQDKAAMKADQLSGGQRQRLSLALALVHKPDIVVLDEPTTGLDPQARHHMWESIRQIQESGHTVILTTHAMDEAEALCTRVGIIDHGKILALDTPQSLIARLGDASTVHARIALDDEQLKRIHTFPGVQAVVSRGAYLDIQTRQPEEVLAHLQQLATDTGKTLAEPTVRQPNLEDVFLMLTGHAIRD
ncbi:MAG TPA: ABC transporter ATP-binding protein [Ktedonobacterales bacterium]